MSPPMKIILTCLFFYSYASSLYADSNSINKVEHPYVNSQEKEISFASFYQKDHNNTQNHTLKHKLSLGWAFSDKWFAEFNIAGKHNTIKQRFAESSYEIELKRQLTEQGQYTADYGVIFAYEKEDDINIEEVSINFLVEKQWGKWVGTANLKNIYEWGNDINNEFESALAAQAKYRYKASLEPAIELYAGEKNQGIGPVLTGFKRLAPGKKLFWEFGLILGLNQKSPDQTYRALLEYEF